jgi:replication factor C subunit 1
MFADTHKPQTTAQVIGAQYSTMSLLSWLRSWGTPQRQFRAAMLSGPPGVGKSALADLVYAEAGMCNVLHIDSSRKRTKKALAEVEEAFMSRKIDAYLTGKMQRSRPGGLVIDDLDAMVTGAADRGGVPQIVAFIRTSRIPVLCICNDPTHRALRTLLAQCMHVRMQRPAVEGIARRLLDVARAERITIDIQRARDIAIRSGCDVRQALNDLQFSLGTPTAVPPRADHAVLNVDRPTNPFDAAAAMFGCRPRDSVRLGCGLYDTDPMLGPALVHENYHKISQGGISALAAMAEAISAGNALERSGRWGVMPRDMMGLMTCSMPCIMAGCRLDGRVDFPAVLGKTSTINKNARTSRDLANTIERRSSIVHVGPTFATEIATMLYKIVAMPLVCAKNGPDTLAAVRRAASAMREMGLSREDLDAVHDLGIFPMRGRATLAMPSKAKAALTREMNAAAPRPRAAAAAAGKNRARLAEGRIVSAAPQKIDSSEARSDDDDNDDDDDNYHEHQQ